MTPQASQPPVEHIEGAAEGWRPEPGDVVEGKIVDVDEATSTQKRNDGTYPKYPLLTIAQADGAKVLVHAFHQTLQRAILTRRPEIGHRVRITFHGKQKLKSDDSRSVAVYSMELPDTPRSARSVYDRLERNPVARQAPAVEPDVPIAMPDDDIDF